MKDSPVSVPPIKVKEINTTIYSDELQKIRWKDVRQILPTVIILVFTVFIMVTIIPYAFASVIKQLQAVHVLDHSGEVQKSNISTPTTKEV